MNKDTVVFNFGRYQGPHKGHEMLFDFMKTLSIKHNADYFIFPSQTHNTKNPIKYNIKLQVMRLLLPEHIDNIVSEHDNNIIKILQKLQLTYNNVIFVCGSDQVESCSAFLTTYNGLVYSFDSIELMVCGKERTTDSHSDSISSCSATKMRQYIIDNDFDSFCNDAPLSASTESKQFAFDLLKQKTYEKI